MIEKVFIGFGFVVVLLSAAAFNVLLRENKSIHLEKPGSKK